MPERSLGQIVCDAFNESDHPRGKGGRFGSGAGGEGPAGHTQMHKRLTSQGYNYSKRGNMHVWFNPKEGKQTQVPVSGKPTDKPPAAPSTWYSKVEAEHGPSRPGPNGSRITGSGYQQRQWSAPRGNG